MHPEGTNPAVDWRRKCEDFASRNGAARACGEGGAKKGGRRAPGRHNSGGGNVKILLPGMEPQGLAGRGSKERKPPAVRKAQIRRRDCEDFAPRNGATRVSGERGAKRGHRRATARVKSGGGNVKILLPGTELQGFAGSGERGAKRGRRRLPGRPHSGPCSGICTRKNLHFYTQSCIIIPTPLKTPRRSGFTAISIREIAVNPYYHRVEASMRV